MKHTVRSVVLTFLLLWAAGCSSLAIRPGVWELFIEAQDYETKKDVSIPDAMVRVRVEPEESGVQGVELQQLEIKTDEGYRTAEGLTIWGRIAEDRETVTFRHQTDDFWVFDMQGTVINDETVDGTFFRARHRRRDDVFLTGSWRLVRRSD